MTFRELPIGYSFDWIDDENPRFNSFYLRCVKVSARTYIDEHGSRHAVGSVKAQVFHVKDESRNGRLTRIAEHVYAEFKAGHSTVDVCEQSLAALSELTDSHLTFGIPESE